MTKFAAFMLGLSVVVAVHSTTLVVSHQGDERLFVIKAACATAGVMGAFLWARLYRAERRRAAARREQDGGAP